MFLQQLSDYPRKLKQIIVLPWEQLKTSVTEQDSRQTLDAVHLHGERTVQGRYEIGSLKAAG